MTKAYKNAILGTSITASGVDSDVGGLLSVQNTGVALSGHVHTVSQITDFNSVFSSSLSGSYGLTPGAVFPTGLTATSGNFTNNVRIGSSVITSGLAAGVINSINFSNLYLWSTFR